MRKSEIPDSIRGRPISTSALLSLGIPRSRLAQPDARRPHHGVAVFGEPLPTVVERCSDYEPIMLPGQFFSHRTAAELWGMALPPARDHDALGVDVAVLDPRTPPRRQGVAGRRVSGVRVTMLHGYAVASAADAWCQLGEVLSRNDLVAAGDSALVAPHRDGITTLLELQLAVARHRRKRGADIVAAAFPLLRVGTESRMETLLRLLLRRHRLPEPVIGFPVDLGAGFLEHPDLAYPAARIALEYEGDRHRSDRRQWERDVARYERFADAGWRVIRVTAAQLFSDPTGVVQRVRALLRSRLAGQTASTP